MKSFSHHKQNSLTLWNLPPFWPYIFIVFFLFPLAIIYGQHMYAPCDDAYIFFVYARNFIAGNGLTYNGVVVEGFTSVLWVTTLSVLGLTKLELPFIAENLSILTGLFTLIATYKLATSQNLEKRWALVPVILLAATGDFAFYMSVGLEQILFTGLVTLNIALVYLRNPREILCSYLYPLLLALMILTRPEGALIAALLLLMLALRSRSLSSAFRCGIILTIFLLPVMVAKWTYYGYWLPNTYYVKSSLNMGNLLQGLEYLLHSYLRYGVVAIFGIALIIWSFYKNGFMFVKKDFWFLLLISAVWIIYITVQGGDNMVGGRALLPILPLIYVLFVKLATSNDFSPKPRTVTIGFVTLSLILGYLLDPYVAEHADNWRVNFVKRQNAGYYLRDNFPPDTLVALNPAGIIPYYSQLPTIDMLGLNDIHIAHNGERDQALPYGHQAGDGLYVLSEHPDVIIFGAIRKLPGPYISDQEIWNSAQFRDNYELQEWPSIGYVYVRKNN